MKTTIKLTTSTGLTVRPCKAGGVTIELTDRTGNIPRLIHVMHLTQDMAGALIFALEQACETNELAAARGSEELLNDKG